MALDGDKKGVCLERQGEGGKTDVQQELACQVLQREPGVGGATGFVWLARLD